MILTVAAMLVQYYFETIFPRIPKPVQDDLAVKLAGCGLPVKAIGNAGQGGGDRRGVDEPNRRPASVKVRSLSVAVGCIKVRFLGFCGIPHCSTQQGWWYRHEGVITHPLSSPLVSSTAVSMSRTSA